MTFFRYPSLGPDSTTPPSHSSHLSLKPPSCKLPPSLVLAIPQFPSVLATTDMVSSSFAALVIATANLALRVDAHSHMIDPMPTWPVSWATNNFAATIAGQTYLPCPDGMSYSTAPELNTEAYWTAFNELVHVAQGPGRQDGRGADAVALRHRYPRVRLLPRQRISS